MKPFLLSATCLFFVSFFSAQVAQSELISASSKWDYLEYNNVKAIVANGPYIWNYEAIGQPGYSIKEFDRFLAYSSHIWLGTKTSGGILKFAGGLYNNNDDFYIGPYSTSGVQSDFQKYDRVWKLTRAEVLEFKNRYNDPDYIIPEAILTWPAHGDESLGQAKNLAPFHDINKNGLYEPSKGDYPEFDFDNALSCDADKLYGDQVIYAIFHDAGDHTETGGEMLKAEIHLQAFAYATGDELNNTTFYRYTVYNRSEQDYTDFAFGFYNDPDIGCYGDDYVGSSEDRGLAYAYTGQQYDGTGGPGCIGQPWDNVSPIFGLDIVSSPKNKVDNFGAFSNSLSTTDSPNNRIEYYNYMYSKWLDGQHFVEGGCGHPNCGGGTTETDYIYNDNIGWTEYSEANSPDDRRLFFSVRDMEFKRNTPLTFVVAAMFDYIPLTDYEPDQMNLINKLKATDDKIQAFADANFPYCERTLDITENGKTYNTVEAVIYPNPNNGKGKLLVSNYNGSYSLQIFDVSGKLVFSEENILAKEFEFNLEHASGYYTYKVSGDKFKPIIGKLIVE